MKIVLNAILVKQKGTGGYNVAINFFRKTLEDKENEWFYFVSQEFDYEINGLELGLDSVHYYVFHSQPNIKYYFKDRSLIRKTEEAVKPDVIYSILAPSYHKFKTPEVMRCANAWSVVGGVNKYALKVTPAKLRIFYFAKGLLTRMLMRNTRYFITQTEIAKKCILRSVKTKPENVSVVSNVLPEKYQKADWKKSPHKGLNLVYVAAAGVHKDHLILPQVASLLTEKYGMKDFKVHITIPEDDAYVLPLLKDEQRKFGVEDLFVNHGLLRQDELIDIYSQCDIGLFPSLLETFSVTLLEYMHFELPIIASDLGFIKEVAEDAAVYFKPHDAEDFAEKIYQVYTDKELCTLLLEKGQDRLSLYDSNKDKYSETVNFLRMVYDKSKSIDPKLK